MLNIENADPDFLSSFDLDEVKRWVEKHPQANVTIGYWMVTIKSPLFEDVNHEAYDKPFEWDGATEEFRKSKDGDGWFCEWHVC